MRGSRWAVLVVAACVVVGGCTHRPAERQATPEEVAQRSEEHGRRLLAEAEQAFDNEDYERALRLTSAWKPFPEDLSASIQDLHTQAWAKIEEEEARERRERARAAVDEAHQAFDRRNWAAAVARYQEATRLDPEVKAEVNARLQQAQASLERERERAERERERERLQEIAAAMNRYETESGSVALAVAEVRMTTTAGQYRATGSWRFVRVDAVVRNTGTGIVHANPHDFTLSTPDGYTVSPDKGTYSLGNYFNAVDLRPDGRTSGWLIFYLPQHKEYTLHYQSLSGRASKRIAFP